VPVEQLRAYEEELYRHLDTRAVGVLASIAEKKILDDEVKAALEAALEEFGKDFAARAEA
jgi:F0F1-type ATP synthase alpha subunit